MYKIDLHTHSVASHDGGLKQADYQRILSDGTLDYVAITDHNRVDFAEDLQQKLGDKIIVGEEIMTIQGEIIGLFLQELVRPGMSAADTVKAIKQQGGTVYIPHPFETVRKGLHPSVLDQIINDVDIIEVCNGRALNQKHGKQAIVYAHLNRLPGAASSDAHGIRGIGTTFSDIADKPTQASLPELFKTAQLHTKRPSARAVLYPKYNKLLKKVGKNAS